MVAKRSRVSEGLFMPVEQYLALDEATDGKYEYLHGYVFMVRPPSSAYLGNAAVVEDMAGGSPAHGALAARAITVLNNALEDSPCIAYTSDTKAQLAEDVYVYPDVLVSCEEPDHKSLTSPTVIIEVLSPNTEKRDRYDKIDSYKKIASVQEYLLIGSERKEIIIHRRETDWRPYHYRSGDLVELRSLGISIPFEDFYHKVKL
jgi:Uma2 family endonuclease